MAEEELDLEHEDEEIETEEELQPPKKGFFSSKRLVIVVAIVVLVLAIGGGFFVWNMMGSSTPVNTEMLSPAQQEEIRRQEAEKRKEDIEYEVLYSDITPEQATEIIRYLTYMRVAFQSSGSSDAMTITVDSEELERAKSQLAIKGIPAGAPQGYALLDSGQTLGVTEFDKRVRFLRALSGELEKAIMQFEMIETCKVQVVLPEQRLFAVTQPPVTASILIRKRPGVDLTDDIVFSIIQLVSNAVENLQPENVSVITTEGRVLSTGIFERMAAKEAGIIVEEPGVEETEQPSSENVMAFGQVFVPNFSDIKKWYEIKNEYEQSLTIKAQTQITGIVPADSFKIAVSADLGPLENGEIVNVERLSASVVVDSSNENVYLDEVLKKQIFSALAGAVGYVKGRDIINITTADFAIKKEPSQTGKILKKYGNIVGAIVGIIIVLFVLLKIKQALGKRKKSDVQVPSFMNEEKDASALFEEDDVALQQKKKEINDVVLEHTDVVSQLVEDWLEEDKQKEGAS